MKLLDDYFNLQAEIYEFFGYKENWVVIPLIDRTEYVWRMEDENSVFYAETVEDLEDTEAGEYYRDTVYTQRFLTKHIYETETHTMICVDTHCDGNKFLAVYDNKKKL